MRLRRLVLALTADWLPMDGHFKVNDGNSMVAKLYLMRNAANCCRIAGNVTTSNGTGSGSVGATWKRVHSEKMWHDVSLTVGNRPGASATLFRTLNRRTFATMSGRKEINHSL